MIFVPAFVRAEPGDTVTFVPTDKSHNVEAIAEILPEEVERFRSKLNDEFTLTVTEPGLYGVKMHAAFCYGHGRADPSGRSASEYRGCKVRGDAE